MGCVWVKQKTIFKIFPKLNNHKPLENQIRGLLIKNKIIKKIIQYNKYRKHLKKMSKSKMFTKKKKKKER